MSRLLGALLIGLVAAAPGAAQPLTCEDQQRVLREVIARLTAERARSEVETATEMARLKAVIEQLLNERDAARAKLGGPPR